MVEHVALTWRRSGIGKLSSGYTAFGFSGLRPHEPYPSISYTTSRRFMDGMRPRVTPASFPDC